MPGKFKLFRWEGKKAVILLVSLLLLITVGIGGTVAFIIDRTTPVENAFEMGRVDSEPIVAQKDGKNTVSIQNTGDIDAYIRVAVIITWVASETDGHTVTHVSEPMWQHDYYIEYAIEDTDWLQNAKDGLWYYVKPVAGGEITPPVILDYTKLSTAEPPEGYKLSIEVLSSAIQANPADAVIESWGIDVDENGHLVFDAVPIPD
jgi:hypothetical protein